MTDWTQRAWLGVIKRPDATLDEEAGPKTQSEKINK